MSYRANREKTPTKTILSVATADNNYTAWSQTRADNFLRIVTGHRQATAWSGFELRTSKSLDVAVGCN